MKSPSLLGLLLLCLALAAGCGTDDEKRVASQVAVKVNSDEITVHQVNAVLARARDIAAEDVGRAKREVVERLIGQELARQQAVVKKLDRSPQVVQAIEAARAEILARAYLQQVTAGQAKPTPEEVKKYYAEHSELFSGRRVYALEEISLVAGNEVASELRRRVAGARSLQEISDWLHSRQVRFTANRMNRPAEDIPLGMLPTLKDMKDGDIRMAELGGRVYVVRLIASRPAPVDEAAASPRIEQFLANQRSTQSIAEELQRLRAQARIEYVGEFAGGAAKARPTAAAQEQQSPTNLESAIRALR